MEWRRLPVRRLCLWLAGAALVLVAGLATNQQDALPAGIATVDSETITRADFERYASIFVIDGGRRLLSNEYVLLALVNQTLVLQEADRRGITVPSAHVDAEYAAAIKSPIMEGALQTQAERSAFRSLMERKLRFDAVKDVITGQIAPTDEMIKRYFESHREDYPLLTLDDVRFEISTILKASMVDATWRGWLAHERACSRITVVDPAFKLPPETFEGQCILGASV